jgi:exodeoxyribonuclease V
MKLTKDQKAAQKEITSRIDGGQRYTCLRGYAGTGKTYLMGHLIEDLADRGLKVYLCAPTHKAARVLSERVGPAAYRVQTIHSFLGLRLRPDGSGGYSLQREDDHEMPRDAVVIVDEASMIGREEWFHIERAWDLQWIFVGDPAQLPPVNEPESPVFELPGPELTEVVRQARGNPIIQLATCVRDGERIDPQPAFDGKHGIGVTSSPKAFLDSAVRSFSTSQYEDDSSFARILAYRNRTVARYNRAIRSRIFPEAKTRFVEDEWLVAKESWFVEDAAMLINSEEVRVQHVEESDDDANDLGRWRTWELSVLGLEDDEPRTIIVLHEDEADRFQRKLTAIKNAARRGDVEWKQFYQLRERYAQVDYSYASTIHKAQGSTFHTAFVDLRDTAACRGEEASALLYVAVTRPAARLALLR